MEFFSQCKTQEEAKVTFKRLCKCFHPDKGGEEALMIELKKQYDNWQPYGNPSAYVDPMMVNVYEKKIMELNQIIFQLRRDMDLIKNNTYTYIQQLNAEMVKRNYYAEEVRRKDNQINSINEQIQSMKDSFENQLKKKETMSLMDKVRFVFGYE